MPEYTGPHDYFDENYVLAWTSTANTKRPLRAQLFEAFIAELKALQRPKVLELGSGPGFLAERVLAESDVESYHLFDFSPLMLNLSRNRLARFAGRAVFYQGSFLADEWWRSLPAPFDAIVSLQAVHEVREAARIPRLYREAGSLLDEGGLIVIGDEVNGEQQNEEHLLTLGEHETALQRAGFAEFRQVCQADDLVLFSAKYSGLTKA